MDKIADGVYEIAKGFRAFVIDGDDGLTLIDAGLPKKADLFVAGIESIGRSITDVRAIVLTHNHADHVGSAAKLKAAANAEIYCSKVDAPAVRGDVEADPPPVLTRFPFQVFKPLLRLLPSPQPAAVDHEISAGASLPDDIEVVPTPGHTAGHMSYRLDRAGGILFVGDAATQKNGTVSRGWMNRPGKEFDESLHAISRHDFQVACFGHSAPIKHDAAGAFRRFVSTL